MWSCVVVCFVTGILALVFLIWVLRIRRSRIRETLRQQYGLCTDYRLIAFFHPFCTSRGGGERVLWTAIRSMQLDRSKADLIVVYTQDPRCLHERELVLQEVQQTFGVQLDTRSPLHFVLLHSTPLLSPRLYPILTLAGQALGSLLVGLEALIRCPPDFFLDTTGFAFILPLAKRLFGAKTGAYVHYPTISSDMLGRVSSSSGGGTDPLSEVSYNNASWIRNSRFLTQVKLLYYRLFIETYRWVGSTSNVDAVMTNSTWTRNHIRSLWGGKPTIVYPPCPTEDLITNDYGERKPWIVSVGQFRPEKNHELQLEAFSQFLTRFGLTTKSDNHSYRLLLIGGCRDEMDDARVAKLRRLVRTLNLQDVVEFHVNVSYNTLKQYFRQSMINLHTMVDEHFGIGIVEGMAAGLITVAHNSGGPQSDIIGPARVDCTTRSDNNNELTGVGFLARTADEYAHTLEHILKRMSESELDQMRRNARNWVQTKFSESCFSRQWLQSIHDLGL